MIEINVILVIQIMKKLVILNVKYTIAKLWLLQLQIVVQCVNQITNLQIVANFAQFIIAKQCQLLNKLNVKSVIVDIK